jgi:molybdate transport system ATP-binding protein
MLVGVWRPARGRIRLDGAALDQWSPESLGKHIGYLPQDVELLAGTVAQNIGRFLMPQDANAVIAAANAAGVHDMIVGLPEGYETQVGESGTALSAGQAQRVALARALASQPNLLLLDEPLSALDVATRTEVRRELRRHLAAFGGIRLLVTHDPIDALALADRLVVLEHGQVVQSGSSLEVTAQPRSRYVADFVGVNWLRGRAAGAEVTLADGGVLTVPDVAPGAVFVVIHPRAVALHRQKPEGSPRNVLRGAVVAADDEGPRVRVRLTVPFPLVAEVTRAAAAELELDRGGELWVAIKATEIATYAA